MRRSKTSASAATTAAQCARRTCRKRPSRWSRTSRTGFTDPCDPGRINTNANRAANCAADLGALLGGLSDVTYSLPIVSGSNPNLEAEKSDSWTYGVVIQPRFVPGLNLSVDYYDIKVKGIIASLTAQQIVNSCYDSPI